MPVVSIEYDKTKVTDEQMKTFVKDVYEIVSNATDIKEVPVYANAADITYKIYPLEVFVRVSAHKVPDREAVTEEITKGLSVWRKENSFEHLINFTLMPEDWNLSIDIE